jgi:serine/threonine protein kinase
VELHRRVDRQALAVEVSILLECRHPNILFMLGFTLDDQGVLGYGPLLIMEPSWGSVSKVLYMQRLRVLAAIRIADQVVSALHYLHRRRIYYGSLDVHNVMLSDHPDHPRRENFTAKLTNFNNATLGVGDERLLARDIQATGVFAANLFAEDMASIVRFDVGNLRDEQWRIRRNLEAISSDHSELAVFVLNLVSLELATAQEMDARLSELHALLRSSIAEPRLHASSPRSAPYPAAMTSARQGSSSQQAPPEESENVLRL